MVSALSRFKSGQEFQFFVTLQRGERTLASVWWLLVILRGLLPAMFAIVMGILVGSVERHADLAGPLKVAAGLFILLQVLPPIHTAVSANLGDRTAARLFDRMGVACSQLTGIGHLESPSLAQDLSMARDFDLGITAPPLFVSMDFIAQGLVDLLSGASLAVILFAYTWWAGLLISGAWLSTHWLLKESSIWRDRNTDEVRAAQRESDYNYRLAVTPEPAKELRLFGLSGWTMERFLSRRRRLFELQYRATRLRQRPLFWCVLIVLIANVVVLYSLGSDAAGGDLSLGQVIVFVQAATGASLIAFGGLNWALDGSAAPVAAVSRLESAMLPVDGSAGFLMPGTATATGLPAHDVTFDRLSFRYQNSDRAVLNDFSISIPAGTSLAIVGQNGAGKTTIAKLLCRLYDPSSGAILVDGTDIRELDLSQWRSRVAAVFQDYVRYELTLRENVAPMGAPDDVIRAALQDAGAAYMDDLDVPLARGYERGTELSGGQWQRIALARALCAVRLGAGLVILDEPTAQLDVRGESEIFERLLTATRNCTTILVSHRFSTVRKANRICVIENGSVVEFGSHEDLIQANGRYAAMFNLQAQRFVVDTELDEEGSALDVLD